MPQDPTSTGEARPTNDGDAGARAWRRASRGVGIGLAMIGVALGILYWESRLVLESEQHLRLVATLGAGDGRARAAAVDDFPDLASLGRVLTAGVFGCVGVGLAGASAVSAVGLGIRGWRRG